VVSLLALSSLAACGSSGGLGEVLSGVLGGGAGAQGAQLAGTIAGVNTSSQQIGIQQSNGQTVGVSYDENTKVVFNNQNYPVTALEQGDQVVARVIDRGNGAYYTDSVQVTASVQGSGGTSTSGGAVQQLSGTVRQVDRTNGLFALDMQGTMVTVSMPYNPRTADASRFQNLRVGEQVRIAGVFLNNTRVELRQFY
jgi:hypothetical protein